MRSSWKTLVAAAAGVLLVPQLAAADDVQEQLRQMQERMSQLEDRLQATTEELDKANERVEDQEQIIERSGIADERSGLSALSRFLNATEFSGVAAASYNWNFNDPSNAVTQPRAGTAGGENTGVTGLTAPFHSNHNNFQVDQVLFSMVKPSTEESRGGFGVDLAFGASADALNAGSLGTGDNSFLYQGYASYLAPIMNGVLIQAGRYETILGAEVFRVGDNFNITRGLVYALQPTNHTGVLLTGDLGSGWWWKGGISNNNTNTQVDTDNAKTGLVGLGWAGETAGVGLNWMIGGDVVGLAGRGAGTDSDNLSQLDLVTTWDPSDNLSVWLNFDWITQRNDQLSSLNVYAAAVAGRLALSDQTGISTRFEYVKFEDVCNLTGAAGGGSPCAFVPLTGATDDVDMFSITGTLDHALTDNLIVRGEVRYDWGKVDTGNNDLFVSPGATPGGIAGTNFAGADDQILALVQMMYEF